MGAARNLAESVSPKSSNYCFPFPYEPFCSAPLEVFGRIPLIYRKPCRKLSLDSWFALESNDAALSCVA